MPRMVMSWSPCAGKPERWSASHGKACVPDGAAATGEDAAVAVAAEVPLRFFELLELDDGDLSAGVPSALLASPSLVSA
jgi:hypothetical protein